MQPRFSEAFAELDLTCLEQISASATSPSLSDKAKYGSFLRTIGNDELQGEAIIKLVKLFGWNVFHKTQTQ